MTRPPVTSPVTEGTSPRTCRHCGARFEPTYAVQCFCEPSCRQAHRPPTTGPQATLPFGDLATLFDVPFEED